MRRFQSFVEIEGCPYRFVVVGRLSSFQVVEDSFGHFLSVNIGGFQTVGRFGDMFIGQLRTLQKIEEDDRLDEALQAQEIQWRTCDDMMNLKAYNISNYSLSSSDIGAFLVAIIELRCLDVSCGASKFERTYWSEALSLRSLKSDNVSDEKYVENIINRWKILNPSIVSNV
ncbi:hypothetical protein BYT27DRAFT_7247198 [Phlegmacium glaucopus]|nr:hypothetical protein BYT27DRAFT_7247198 [Phlegmacium glaucopus]